jgi:hypothetical protein
MLTFLKFLYIYNVSYILFQLRTNGHILSLINIAKTQRSETRRTICVVYDEKKL